MSTSPRQKILYIITKSNWGGAQAYVHSLAAGLPKEQFDVVVALGGEGLLKQKLEEAGVRTITIPRLQRDINIVKDSAIFFSLFRLFKQERPDIIHLNSSKIGGLGALAGRIHNLLTPKRNRAQIIFTVHGWAFLEQRSFVQLLFIKIASWLTALFSHTIITVSKNDAWAALWMPFVQQKISTVYNGVSPLDVQDKDFARKELDIPNDGNVLIGCIAELHANKGHEYLIEALAMLKEGGLGFRCVLIGEGEEGQNLEARIERRNLSENVRFTGFLENAAALLSAFDIFVLPSTKEGLPYTLLEAGVAGLPIVSTRIGGIPEIIEHGQSGLLVNPHDPRGLHDALENLLANAAVRGKMGEAAQKKIADTFSVERMVTETMEVYKAS